MKRYGILELAEALTVLENTTLEFRDCPGEVVAY